MFTLPAAYLAASTEALQGSMALWRISLVLLSLARSFRLHARSLYVSAANPSTSLHLDSFTYISLASAGFGVTCITQTIAKEYPQV